MNELIETSDYWIKYNCLIFKPKFNASLNKYADLLSKYSHLIFSNYNDWKICIETDNVYNSKYDNKYVRSKFNQPIKLNQNLTHLNMGHNFNHPIELNQNLTHLTMGDNFDQTIELNQNLTHLTMGHNFNQPIQLNQNLTHLIMGSMYNRQIHLNENLTHLTMGHNFNQPIQLTDKIKYLCLNSNPHNLIDNLLNGIEELELGDVFNSQMNNLPTSIKILKLNCDKYNHELNCLPMSIEYLKLNESYNKKISNIPKGLKKIVCLVNYPFVNDFDLIIETFYKN